MTTKTLSHDDIPTTYRELTELRMPRPLHDEVDYHLERGGVSTHFTAQSAWPVRRTAGLAGSGG